jgi:hypothetical protein
LDGAKLALHIGNFIALWERLGDYHRRWWPGYTLVRPILSYASLVWWKRVELKKCSDTALSLAADDMFGNYWWYAFNTNVYFSGYVNVATLTFVHKTIGQIGGL